MGQGESGGWGWWRGKRENKGKGISVWRAGRGGEGLQMLQVDTRDKCLGDGRGAQSEAQGH